MHPDAANWAGACRMIKSELIEKLAAENTHLTHAEVERVVWPWVASGKVKAVVDATFPLAEAAKAHAHLEAGAHVGKVLLIA